MKKGMTLIELLVSSLILVIGVTALMWSFVQCKHIIRRNTHKMNATTLVNQWFEGVQRRETNVQFMGLVGSFPPGSPMTMEKEIRPGVMHNYFVEFDTSVIMYTASGEWLTQVAARISWDNTYTPDYSRNQIEMEMLTNEPKDAPADP